GPEGETEAGSIDSSIRGRGASTGCNCALSQRDKKGSRSCLFVCNARVRCAGGASGRGAGALVAVALAELVDAARGVDHLLLSGVEGVAHRADFDVQWLFHRRARGERVAAAAGHLDFAVFRM